MTANHYNPSVLDSDPLTDSPGSVELRETPPFPRLPEHDEDDGREAEPALQKNGETSMVEESAGEVLRLPLPAADVDDDRRRPEALDDPVRMYLKQMGPVALLTAEQEVEICRRIEKAQGEVTQILYHLGFAGKEHIALADRLLATPPQERFDRVISDRKIECRDKHLKYLARLVSTVRHLDEQADEAFGAWHDVAGEADNDNQLRAHYKGLDKQLQSALPRFEFQRRFIDDLAAI